MALFCRRHHEGPLDVWYDCDACCQEDDKEESVKHIRKMTCADHKALRICRSGVVQEIHLVAARRLFNDSIKGRIEKNVAVLRAKRLEKISPAASALLKDWIKQWTESYRGLTAEEVPDTDDEYV